FPYLSSRADDTGPNLYVRQQAQVGPRRSRSTRCGLGGRPYRSTSSRVMAHTGRDRNVTRLPRRLQPCQLGAHGDNCAPTATEDLMSSLQLPEPSPDILARRDRIIAELKTLVGADAVVSDEDGRRAYETDGLTA